MAGDREGPLMAAGVPGTDLDLARQVGLDPHRRIALPDVSKDGSEEQPGHSRALYHLAGDSVFQPMWSIS